MLIGAHILNSYQSLTLLPITDPNIEKVQLLIQVLFFLKVGFWSCRQEADDDENVKNFDCRFLKKRMHRSFRYLFFTWLTPLINYGNEKPIEQKDIWGLIDEDKTEFVMAEYYNRRY